VNVFGQGLIAFHTALQAERERWLLWLPVGLGLGIGGYFACPTEPSLWWLLLTPLLLGLSRVPQVRRHIGLYGSLLVCALGFNAAQLASWRADTPLLQTTRFASAMTGRVVGLDPATNGVTLLLDQLDIPDWPTPTLPPTLRLKLRGEPDSWPAIGSRVRLAALLMPLNEPVAPTAYDFRRQGYFNGIGAQGMVRGALQVLAPPPPTHNILLWIAGLRGTIAQRVMQHLSGDTAQIAVALLNGAQSGISAPVRETMRASGLFHILSISGLHLAIVAAFMFVGVRRLLAAWPYAALYWPIKKIAAGLALFILPLYTLLVGAPVPAVRSALMTGVLLLAVLAERRALSLRTVALAASGLLLIVPQALLGASFQLSFAAVTVMVAGYETLRRWRQPRLEQQAERGWWGRLGTQAGRWGGGMLLTSLLASLATAPLTLFQFQQANWYGVVANLVGIPLTSLVIMPAGFLAYGLMPFGLDGTALAMMGWGIERLIALAATVAAWPGTTLTVTAWPLTGFLGCVAGGLWLCLWQRRWRLWGLVPMAAGLLWCVLAPQPDIYLAPQFTNWAVRDAAGSWLAQHGGERNFTVQQWRQRTGNADFINRKTAAETEAFAATLNCDAQACLYHHPVGDIVLAEDAAAVAEECGHAALIITPLWRVSCTATPVIDGERLKWRGATTVAVSTIGSAGLVISSARARWGARPWSPGWRGFEGLSRKNPTAPAAEAEPEASDTPP
jgi:competence protein ComEC